MKSNPKKTLYPASSVSKLLTALSNSASVLR